MRFKEFLLNEQSAYLAQKIGDILSGLHDLRDDAKNMGTRDLVQYTNEIVKGIRRVLHSSWPKEERPNLARLQKVGVSLMVAIDKKSDLPNIITAAASQLEKLVADLGVPINKMMPTDNAPASGDNKGTGGSEKAKQAKSGSQVPPAAGPQTAAAGAPPAPQQMDQSPQGVPPTGSTGQDMAAPPLGGTTGGLDAF